MKIFDPHIRSRTQSEDDLKNLHYFGTEAVVTTAHGGQSYEHAGDLIAYFETLVTDECRRLQRCQLTPYVALGVVPNARPRRAHYEVFKALASLLTRPEVVALGEVGVWEDREDQWELFERQVRIAGKVGPVPIIVTTPRELKITLTYKMMNRLQRWRYPPELVMMNYLDERLVENVVESGFCAGYPVGAATNEPRESAKYIAQILERREAVDQILLTSALRSGGGDVLGVPKTIAALQEQGVQDSQIQQMVYGNAARLFGGAL